MSWKSCKADDERCAPIKTSTAERLHKNFGIVWRRQAGGGEVPLQQCIPQKAAKKTHSEGGLLGKREIRTHFQL